MALVGASHQKLDLLNGQGHISCLFTNHDQSNRSTIWVLFWFRVIVAIVIIVVIVAFIMCTLTIRRRQLRPCARIRDWDLWWERCN